MKYNPHPKQKIIHNALYPYLIGGIVMVIAGRRFGKTILAVNEMLDRAINLPGCRIWYVAPTKNQAYRIAWRVLLDYLPKELIAKKREDQHYIELTNGSLIEFLGTQDEIFLLGAGLEFVVFDEFPTIPYSVWFDTVKPMLADHNGDALFIGTLPDPKIHNITPEFLEMYEGCSDRFNFTSFDNPHINHEKVTKDVEDLVKKGRKKDAERLYFGKYTREHGLVFPKFEYDKHTVEPFEIPGKWLRAMAVDPHPQKPIDALWCAIDPRGHYWFYREAHFEDNSRPLTVMETAYEITLAESQAKEKILARMIDPTFAKVQQNALGSKSVKDIFKDYGLQFRDGDREFLTFFNSFTDMLVSEPEPTVHIFRTCHHLIRQIQNYIWDSWQSSRAREEKGVKDRPKKKDDDFIDCMKLITNANLSAVDLARLKSQINHHREKLRARWAKQQEALA